MGWDGCWDKDHLLKSEGLPNLFRPPEMTQMDRVEGTSKEPNPLLRCPCFYLEILLLEKNVKCQSSNAKGMSKFKVKNVELWT